MQIVSILAVLLSLTTGRAWATFNTPSSKVICVYEPVIWQFGGVSTFDVAWNTLWDQGYDILNTDHVRKEYVVTADPTICILYNFANDLASDHGVFLLSTHGVGGSYPWVAIEAYENSETGRDNRNFWYDYYLSNGDATSSELWSIDDANGYYIVARPALIQRFVHNHNTITYLSACNSTSMWSAWASATLIGYENICFTEYGHADAVTFWERMNGQNGRLYRDVLSARNYPVVSQLTNLTIKGNTFMVLAPAVDAVHPTPSSTIRTPTAGYVEFDTYMDTSPVSSPPTFCVGSDGIRLDLSSQAWASPTRLSYILKPVAPGTGSLWLYNYYCKSSGGIGLNPDGQFIPESFQVSYAIDPENGAAAVTSLRATNGAGTNRIEFDTQWEEKASAFSVLKLGADGTAGDTIATVPAVGGGWETGYAITDPGGSIGGRYLLVEHQSGDPPTLIYGTCEAREPWTMFPQDSLRYDQDSLAAYVATLDDTTLQTIEDICSELHPTYAILCPDSFVTALRPYASIWANRGVDTRIISASQADSCWGGYRGLIQYAFEHGTRYVLLVGDANDAEWWDEPSKWTNGWMWPRITPTGPHIPSQPERNIIPTYYTPDLRRPDESMSFYTPYYASDNPYADVYGDYLPDVAVGRLPAGSIADINAYTAKLATFLSRAGGGSWSRAYQLTYAEDNGEVNGEFVEQDADSIAEEFPGYVNLTRYDNTNDTRWEYAFRESLAIAAANMGPDLITWVSSGAQRYIHGNYWRIDQGWSMNKLAPNPAQFFLSLGLSCDMGNFDQSEMYASYDSLSQTFSSPIRPIVERLLLDPQRGAIACVGPSRGTFQRGNVLFAREFLRQLYSGGKTVGMAFLIAQRTMLVQRPEFTDLFVSYNLLGDPVIGPYSVTAADGAPKVGKVRLDPPMPNPFNPYTVIRFALPSSGRVSLRIYDARGRLVRALLDNRVLPAGTNRVQWDGRDEGGVPVASGVYLARLDASGRSLKQKLVLLK